MASNVFSTMLAAAAELMLFNQWILLERQNRSANSSGPALLVAFYAFCELLSLQGLQSFGKVNQDTAVVVSVFFPLHLVICSIATLFSDCLDGRPDRNGHQRHEIVASHEGTPTSDKNTSAKKKNAAFREILLLSIPTASAAVINALLLTLIEEGKSLTDNQSVSWGMLWAYAAFLASRSGDYIVCERMDRSLFVWQGCPGERLSALRTFCLLWVYRFALVWLFDTSLSGPIARNVLLWTRH